MMQDRAPAVAPERCVDDQLQVLGFIGRTRRTTASRMKASAQVSDIHVAAPAAFQEGLRPGRIPTHSFLP